MILVLVGETCTNVDMTRELGSKFIVSSQDRAHVRQVSAGGRTTGEKALGEVASDVVGVDGNLDKLNMQS